MHPIVTTPALAECCEFYQRAFKARVLFRADWYVQIAIGDWEIGFLRPNHPTRLPVFQHTTLTRGLCLALEVADVEASYAELQARGVPPLGALREFPNGERSFSVIDPAGIVINVVERHTGSADIRDF
ncbi:MAG TPA: VOC family protein [Solimonas sp.]|nr:VOC family protein [Solimonas sp.]